MQSFTKFSDSYNILDALVYGLSKLDVFWIPIFYYGIQSNYYGVDVLVVWLLFDKLAYYIYKKLKLLS